MNQAYRDLLAAAGRLAITHLGLVNGSGAELTGGFPAYVRQAVTWTLPSDGVIRPTSDLTFPVPAGATVAGWRGYSAFSGGTDYEGADLTPEGYAGQGTYTLLAAGTGIRHDSA